MAYNPFGSREFEDLDGADLDALADVPEGWFVEYKREPCKPRDYAKEVSAFANGRGGWLFIGLEEDTATHRPSGGPGLSESDVQKKLDALRDAVVHNLSPSPFFELRAVSGPIAKLGIPQGRAVIMVRVPQSENTPHVHATGRIYVRQADAANPVEVTARSELDQLYERSARLKERMDALLDRGFDREWAKAFEMPWIHCALVPSPRNRRKAKPIQFEQFRDIVFEGTRAESMLPDVYASSLGFVARNCSSQEDPNGPAMTLEYAFDGSAYVSVPLSSASDTHDEVAFLNSDNGKRFLQLIKTRGLGQAGLFDGTYVIGAVHKSHMLLQGVLREADVDGPYLARLRGLNLFRRVPFLDSAAYVDWCEQHAVPIIHRDEHRFPWRTKDWAPIKDIQSEGDLLGLLGRLVMAFGVPYDQMAKVIEEVYQATARRSVTPS